MVLPGFEIPIKSAIRRLVISVEAREKSGKSHFALTAPGPIAYFDFDGGLQGVVDKFIGTKEIMVATYRRSTSPSTSNTAAIKAKYAVEWEDFEKKYRTAITCGKVRTVVLDTATEVWELKRLAEFGKLDKIMPHHYAPLNAAMTELVKLALGYNTNLIMLHKLKQQYVNDKWNGLWELSGFKDVPYLAQANLRSKYEKGEFSITILDSRLNMPVSGMELTNASVADIASLICPDTDPTSWM